MAKERALSPPLAPCPREMEGSGQRGCVTDLGVPRYPPAAVGGKGGSCTCCCLSSVQWLFAKCSLTDQMMLCPAQIQLRPCSSQWTTSIGSSGPTLRVATAHRGETGPGLRGVRGEEGWGG